MAFSKIVLNGEKLTRENFAQPPMKMGILPFWFWNGKLDKRELEWQLREYADKGITGLFLHGRFGLKVPYLSPEWFDRVKFVVSKAREIGIDIWVYDEMNWPSGTAEKQVVKKYPYLCQKYLEVVVLPVDGPLFTFLEASDSRYVNTGKSKPIAAFACSAEEFEKGIENPIDLTSNLSFEVVIPWEAPAGQWKLLYFLEKQVDYYIDPLNPESTQRFIEITHEGYKKAVGKEFGKIVPGFYTDEPAMYYYQVGVDNYTIPWTSKMFRIFRERRGYDLRPFLPALYFNMGVKTSQIRYDFWRTLTEQYAESYYQQIQEWCEKNGVIFTGHLLFEEWLRMHARCEGNIFKYLKHFHLIGVDHLYPRIGSEDNPSEHVSLKIASSAAHHYGSTRVLCESMGGTYWDCTLERMKWMANWEYVLGVNLFNNHGYHYSIEGERKRDWPPSQFYHHSWWKYYPHFTHYMSRLSHLLSGGRHIAKVLVLYPINSIWTNYTPQQHNEIGDVIEADFSYLCDTLLRLHYDFDYVDEDDLIAARLENSLIKIGDEDYSLLILPPLTHIKRKTFEIIKKFVKRGGKVIADTLLPVEFLETSQTDARKEIKSLFGVDPHHLLQNFLHRKKLDIHRQNSQGEVFVIGGGGLHQVRKKEILRKLLNLCVIPDVIINHEDVFYLHRQKDGYDIYFLVNLKQENLGEVNISFEKAAKPELWNPVTGETKEVLPYSIQGGRLSIRLFFHASESYVIVLKNKIDEVYISETNLHIESFGKNSLSGYLPNSERVVQAKIKKQRATVHLEMKAIRELPAIKLGKTFSFDIGGDNALCLFDWKMSMKTIQVNEANFFKTNLNDSKWLHVKAGAWEMQLPQEREREDYPVTLFYRAYFTIAEMPTQLKLLVDGFSGRAYQLFINGKAMKSKGHRSYLDAEMKEIDIRPYCKIGKNLIAVKLIVNKRTDGILDLIKITGPFALQRTAQGYVIIKKKKEISIGDWTQQGYPFYSGTGVYETHFYLPKDFIQGKSFLSLECGEDIAEVQLNNHPPRILPWHPYVMDISKLIRPGKNTITMKITNTSINLLEGVLKKSGLLTEPQIIHRHLYDLPF